MQSISQLKEQFYQLPQVRQAIRWYRTASARDKLAAKLLIGFGAAGLVYLIFWLPVSNYVDDAEKSLEKNQNKYVWLLEKEPDLRAALKHKGGTGAGGNKKVLQVATDTAKRHQLKLKRFEPDNQGSVKVWLEDMPFDKILTWTDKLNKNHGIKVSQVRFDKREALGKVNARLILSPQ